MNQLRRGGILVKSGSHQTPRSWVERVALPVVAALIVGVVTRWPIAAAFAALAAAYVPSLLTSTSAQDVIRRGEAVAAWTELLRDSLAASAGLAQTIAVTASVAPPEIRGAVRGLADRIMSGVPMDDALRACAIEMDDESAHEVICALRLAATARSQRLVELLGALADSTRQEVSMRLRVEASRAAARSGVRIVIVFSLAFAALLMVVAHSYLAPFGTVSGQVVLGFVGACYGTGVWLMSRLVSGSSAQTAREVIAA